MSENITINNEEGQNNTKSVLMTLIAIILGVLVLLTIVGWLTHGYIGSEDVNSSLQNTQMIEEKTI